jgi:hypothetical protein
MAHKNTVWFVLDDISKGLVLISKRDCNGSTVHGKYKQRPLEDASDSNIFITSVVPLQLYSINRLEINVFFGKTQELR